MAQATFAHEGNAVDYTPSADVAAGDVVVQGDLVGVARAPIAANTQGSLAIEGVFDFTKLTGGGSAIPAGFILYWDDTNNRVTPTASGNKLLGKTVVAATDNDATARVRLSP